MNKFKQYYCTPTSDDKTIGMWVTMAGHYQVCEHAVTHRVIHEYCLVYCVRGGGQYAVGSHQYTIGAGDAFLIHPDIAHSFSCDSAEGWELWWVHMAGSLGQQLLDQCGFSLAQPCVHIGLHRILTLRFQRVLTILAERQFGYAQDTAAALFTVLIELRKLARSQVFREHHLVEDIDLGVQSLDVLAARYGCSKSHFIRLFKNAVGITPWQYILHLRISKAKELLGQSDLAVRAIADQLGFEDPKYFSRIFKKITGVSPEAFRASTTFPKVRIGR